MCSDLGWRPKNGRELGAPFPRSSPANSFLGRWMTRRYRGSFDFVRLRLTALRMTGSFGAESQVSVQRADANLGHRRRLRKGRSDHLKRIPAPSTQQRMTGLGGVSGVRFGKLIPGHDFPDYVVTVLAGNESTRSDEV